MRHAVIMAGGAGTRLWPLSRRHRPKQLLRLFDGQSLLQLSRQRLAGLFEPGNIWVVTSAQHIERVARELPDIPRENLLGEPLVRDTANAVGLAANLLVRRDPDATMAVFTADHLISPQETFAAAVGAGLDAAERWPDSLVTFGIMPRSAHTGYGYLRRGQAVAPRTWRVVEFKEKPGAELAQQYLRSGEYLWNSGMFVWRVGAILAELERQLPENAALLAGLAADWDRVGRTTLAGERFERLRRVSIDYGVMERAGHVLVVEMNCQWIDVGSWAALATARPADKEGNVRNAPRVLIVEGGNNVVVAEREHLLVVMGLSDVVVVHADDATLVCAKDAAERVKELASLRVAEFGECYE